MTNYQTIARPAEDGSDNMARSRRRNAKDGGGGEATIKSSIINLLNTIVGAGTLAMPAAMSHMGIMLGVFVIVWSGFMSAFGLYLQSRCARYLDRGKSSFFALSQLTYPNAAIVFDAAIAIKCFGVGVSYIIIIGDLMPGVILGFNSDLQSVDYLMDRKFWITVFMLAIIPLSFLKRLDSLKYTSVIALLSIGYLVILVVYHFSADTLAPAGDIRVVGWESPVAMLSALPVVVFAYTCHQNMFSILNELHDNSPSTVGTVIGSSIGSAASIYILVAITGYMTFGNSVVGNIISMYTPNIASTIGKAAIVVLVTFSIPLQMHPCRASIDAVLKWRPNSANSRSQARPGGALAAAGSRPLLNPAAVPAPASDHPETAMSEIRFALITTTLLVMSYITAIKVSSLDRVLAYVGSTGSTSISFILPGLFYYKISDPDSIHHQRLAKEDDDMDGHFEDEDDEDDDYGYGDVEGAGVGQRLAMWRRRFRIDLDHVDAGVLRKMALGFTCYGVLVMVVSLSMNIFMGIGGH
ncbi:hypothetical protein TD95_001429 [Thielaviopsis punctulata]|uniref:Amino acid transporter transmembrane domain-containing protein n=1 Tax=Thielaviopsis punctulata TaxID=72032 RepID=A0A0F4ZBB2_9PEZI|nr:hypothetical protein TD95_001429 [Thielaviopsis punctulata]